MKVYAVDVGDIKQNATEGMMKNITDMNILISFYSKSLCTTNFEIYEDISNNILIDSGAFTFQKGNTDKDKLQQYMNDYLKFVKKQRNNDLIKGFFEMDIDGVIGYDNVLKYRSKLFRLTDKIIPVWHKSLGIEEYKLMCEDYDYISVSCVNNRDIKPENYKNFVKYAHNHNTKIHGLGMTQKKILNKVPFDTVDSSSWQKIVRFGRYNGKKLDSNYIKKNRRKITQLEILDFLQFQEYYYKKWKNYHND